MRSMLVVLSLLVAAAAGADVQRFASLGDFALEGGGVIRDCRIGYRQAGVMNAERSNVIVVTTWFAGRSADLASSVGPGKLFDTDLWHVITIDALGNGVSSSPSNSPAQPGADFPRFTIADMVRSQYELLTRVLKLERVHAVAGLSMGGMQALQWAVSYPGFMNRVVSITGTPRQTSHDLILWTTQLDLLESFSGDPVAHRKAFEGVAGIQMLELRTPAWVERNILPGDAGERMRAHRKSLTTRDPFDYMSGLRAMIGHDIGPTAEAVNTIQAPMLIIVALQDQMVVSTPARELARAAQATLVTLTGDCGHLAPACESEIVRREVAKFLDVIPSESEESGRVGPGNTSLSPPPAQIPR